LVTIHDLISLEIPLDHGFGEKFELLKVAATHARDIHALCSDAAGIIFPKAINPLSDETINQVSTRIITLVSDLEKIFNISSDTPRPVTWEILASSGFLREPDLIDFILARVAEERLNSFIKNKVTSLPVLLLDHSDGAIAEAAQTLLAAESLQRLGSGHSYLALPPELLHKLCWRIVAAIEVIEGDRRPDIIASAKFLLSQYSEADRAQDAAKKIVHLTNGVDNSDFYFPEVSGLHLYTAALSARLELDFDHVLRLLNSHSTTPHALLLSACNFPIQHAVQNIVLFSGDLISSHDAGLFEVGYSSISFEAASEEIGFWASERSQFLLAGISG